LKHVFGQNSNKVIFFPFLFFFVRQQSRFQDQAFFIYIYIYIYIYILARTKQIKNLGVCADFD
jgi:hypothetical protein